MSAGRAVEAHVVVEQTGVFPWWLVLVEGIAAILIGILLFMAPQATLELVIQLFGLFWLVGGVLRIASVFTDPIDRGLKVFVGIIGILAGIAVFRHPMWLAYFMTGMFVIVLGGLGVVIGAISLFMAFRGGGWGAGIVGVLSLLFGLLVLLNPLLAGTGFIFLYAAVSLVGGVISVVVGLKMRKAPVVAVVPADSAGADEPAQPGLT